MKKAQNLFPRAWKIIFLLMAQISYAQNVTQYVDPSIGSEGVGRVFIGPSCPYGMVKPSPSSVSSNSGWLAMPEKVNGFAQVHVSGTGGGPKYGNVLIQPFKGDWNTNDKAQLRKDESISLGYYKTTYNDGIQTEITTSDRASLYQFVYPTEKDNSLLIDAGFFLGEPSELNAREAQQFVGSQVQIVSNHEVSGYTRIRGGWNNGKAYTVYFYVVTDVPFTQKNTFTAPTKVQKLQNENLSFTLSNSDYQTDKGVKTGAFLKFDTTTIRLKVGISFLSELKAKENASQIEGFNLQQTHKNLLAKWQEILGKVQLSKNTPDAIKRMFYTGLYHTMIMPVDRSGENPLWNDNASQTPYYDDFYAIWDTYRTSTPLITLLEPKREVSIVQALIDIYKHDGYLPDARSGNSNGRTQGGSNAEVVIADAFSKDLQGIDYETALEAMLKDATVPPGGNEEAEGRGGLLPYLQLGYIPYGIPRSGNRTVEYSLCDYAIAQVAKGLGYNDIYKQYIKQSENWKNLWRSDYEQDGVKGFVLPRDKDGNWLDDVPFGHSSTRKLTFPYTPDTSYEGPWYLPWWDCFMYEASSWEYSLSIPHDVPGLIESCGGKDAFQKRLDTFFDHGYYNVGNEPSFLTPCLYHWIGRPDLSGDRVREIIQQYYNDSANGLPGNDDSGAMSSWLAFHLMGIYPIAGTNQYVVHAPLIQETIISLDNGKTFIVRANNLSDKNTYVNTITLNGKPLKDFFLTHQQILEGGVLEMQMAKNPNKKSEKLTKAVPANTFMREKGDYLYTYSLHGQTRKYEVYFEDKNDSLYCHWRIMRHGKWESGIYIMSSDVVEHGKNLCYDITKDGRILPIDELFGIVSTEIVECLQQQKAFELDGMTFVPISTSTAKSTTGNTIIEVVIDKDNRGIISSMTNNPAEINWKIEKL